MNSFTIEKEKSIFKRINKDDLFDFIFVLIFVILFTIGFVSEWSYIAEKYENYLTSDYNYQLSLYDDFSFAFKMQTSCYTGLTCGMYGTLAILPIVLTIKFLLSKRMFKNTCLRTLPFFISFLIIGTVLGWSQSYGDLSDRIWETIRSGLSLGIFSCFLCFTIFLIPLLIKHLKENKKQRNLVILFFLVFIIISILSFFLSYSDIMSDFRNAEAMGMHYMGTMADLKGMAFTCGIGWGLHALFYSFYFYLLYKLYSSKKTIKMVLGYILTMSMFIILCCSFLL